MRVRAHTYEHTQGKSEVDFTLTAQTFHPEQSLKEKKSKRLQARKNERIEGCKAKDKWRGEGRKGHRKRKR